MKLILAFCLSIILISCEKAIDIKQDILADVLVVDGSIENGLRPKIVLTSSINYYSKIDASVLAGIMVTNASVTLSNGTTTQQLRPYATPPSSGFQFIYYSTDSANPAAIEGEFGKTYTLTIAYNNREYVSKTTLPFLKKTIDSLWWKKPPAVADSNRAFLMAKVTDPPGYGDYIRYFTRANQGNFLPGANSAFDDQIVDGKTYEIQVDQGIDRNNPPDDEDYGFFKRGDTATIKFTNTDKATYDFWRTIEFAYQNIGNPFSSPTKVLGNVSNGALGAFCGYAVQYKTLIIPK